MNTNKWNIRFLQLAKFISTWSKDPSTQTGAVITCGNQVLSVGFNGFPAGMSDAPALYADREVKYSRIVHCEVNALIYAGKLPPCCTLYTWPFPSCDRCMVQMIQAGIAFFVAPVPSADALERWGDAFDKTRQYASEAGRGYLELPVDLIGL